MVQRLLAEVAELASDAAQMVGRHGLPRLVFERLPLLTGQLLAARVPLRRARSSVLRRGR